MSSNRLDKTVTSILTPNASKSRGAGSMLPSKNYSAFRPTPIPVSFSGLKPNTDYRILVRTSDQSKPEDITQFSTPRNETRRNNNESRRFRNLRSTSAGTIEAEIRPFGTDSIENITDTANINLLHDWSRYWRFFGRRNHTSDVGRNNIAIVPSSAVDGTGKYVNVSEELSSVNIPVTKDDSESSYIKQDLLPDYIQSFYLDPNLLNNDKTCDITDVTLYFRDKPHRTNNRSNKLEPGFVVAIIDVEDKKPITERQYYHSLKYVHWNEVSISEDASAPTEIVFNEPVRLEAGREYAIALMFEDGGYDIWMNVAGHVLANSNAISPGPKGEHRGDFYHISNAVKAISDTTKENPYSRDTRADLKFDIHALSYDLTNPIEVDLVDSTMEYLIVTSSSDNFAGGDWVYQNTADPAKMLTGVNGIAGKEILTHANSTSVADFNLANDEMLVLEGDPLKDEIVEINYVNGSSIHLKEPLTFSVTNGTLKRVPMGQMVYYSPFTNELHLRNSTATAGLTFNTGGSLICVETDTTATIQGFSEIPVNVFRVNTYIDMPSDFKASYKYAFAERDAAGGYIVRPESEWSTLNTYGPNYVTDYDAKLISRSVEINQPGIYEQNVAGSANLRKSSVVRAAIVADNPRWSFESPEIDVNGASILTHNWMINDDASNEHLNNGNALARHISNVLTLDKDREAEDVRVIVNAYRPPGTVFYVYGKIINAADPNPFDDKHWTLLPVYNGGSQISDPDNKLDFKEFEFGFPTSIYGTKLTGTASVTNGTSTITGTSTKFLTDLAANDLVKLYNPAFPENYSIFTVASVTNDTSLTVTENIDTSVHINLASGGLYIIKVSDEYKQTAYNYHINDGVVRYHGPGGEEYDGYSAIAIKIVLLSNSNNVVPKIDDYRAIAITV